MSAVTGPISTLPGRGHAVPDGQMCDEHQDRPAVARIQGETDSMGCEMFDCCQECADEIRAEIPWWRKPGPCGWCKQEATDRRPQRDIDEGMSGPVYYVCGTCSGKYFEHIRQENEERYWDDWKPWWDE